MTTYPQILMFAGPNGSGKSTVTQLFQMVGAYVNADEIEKSLKIPDKTTAKKAAAEIAQATKEILVANRADFTFETVLSTPRNIELLKQARENGYYVTGLYVLTRNPAINVKRVHARKDAGGHFVEDDKTVTRYYRAMKLIPDFCSVCNRWLIFDNSLDKRDKEVLLLATYEDGKTALHPNDIWPEEDILLLLKGGYNPEMQESE